MSYLRASLLCGGAAVYAASRLLKPVYTVRPDLLLDSVSILVPPDVEVVAFWGFAILLAVLVVESTLYRFALRLPWETAWTESLGSSTSLLFLWVFSLTFLPGLPVVPPLGWWLLLDATPWILTLIGLVALHGKVSFFAAHWGAIRWRWPNAQKAFGATIVFAAVLFTLLVAMTPTRRFTEPYDSRWGTGDEPRYVRIAASLLHDGDADISNAADHINRKPEPLGLLSHAMEWPAATIATIGEAVSSLWTKRADQPVPLGGQVIRGKDGGVYYVYLPGFPLLLVPAMTLDAFFFPGRLPVVLLVCLVLGVLTAIATQRLITTVLDRPMDSYLLVAVVSLTLPMFFYNFQIYPEMTAALCLALMLPTLIDHDSGRGSVIVFGLAASLLPWLHTRYYPVLGVCMLGFVYRAWRDRLPWKTSIWALSLPSMSVALQCLYVFHITGSLLPDTLWVLNGYPRGGHLLNPETFSGLYYLLFGREEGLMVYAPVYILAVPGAVAFWRRSSFAGGLSLAIVVPYLWISASHDQGGAGGWSPAARYFVPVIPVLALWVAAWLGASEFRRPRWSVFVVAAAASFWIAQGMLVERNFPYDRNAYLSSGVLNVSEGLGSILEAQAWSARILYPGLLVILLVFVSLGERKERKACLGELAIGIVAILVATGVMMQSWLPREAWMNSFSAASATRLRPERAELLQLPVCRTGSPRLRFSGGEGPHVLTVGGEGLSRHLVVPPGGETEIGVAVTPVRRLMRGDSQELAFVRLELAGGQMPLEVEAICR